MKHRGYKPFLLAVALLCAVVSQVRAQGGFQNLDFESANVVLDPSSPYYPYAAIAASALPGWTIVGNFNSPDIFYNDLSAGSPAVSLQGPLIGSETRLGGPIFEGSYTVVLQAGGSGIHIPVSILQTGLVPLNTESIQMKLSTGASGFSVTLGGQSISMVPLGTGPNYTIFGGSVPSFLVGQSEELDISALPTTSNPFNGFALDSIVFSTSPVPEPASWALLVCGVGAVVLSRRRNES